MNTPNKGKLGAIYKEARFGVALNPQYTRHSEAAKVYSHVLKKRRMILLVLTVLLVIVSTLDISAGAGEGSMSWKELLQALFEASNAPLIDVHIAWDIRLPMTAVAIIAGAALSLAGAQMQTLLDNPLAEPYTLGISASAGFGAALSITTGIATGGVGALFGMAGFAWISAMMCCTVILIFSTVLRTGRASIVLLGVAMVFLFNALFSLMQYMANDVELQQMIFWTLGSLTRASWPQIGVMAAVLVSAVIYFQACSWKLTALRMGELRARSFGINVNNLRVIALIAISTLVATVVAFTGTIGFIGLVGPHIARILVGENHKYFSPAALLCGANLLTAASLASKYLVPGVILPVGIITALVGVPVFLTIIFVSRRRLWG